MKDFNLKANLLKYSLIIYLSNDYDEEYFVSLEDKRYLFKKRIEKYIQDMFSTKVYINSIVLEDDIVVINLNTNEYIEVTKIAPSKLDFTLNSDEYIHKFSFVGL